MFASVSLSSTAPTVVTRVSTIGEVAVTSTVSATPPTCICERHLDGLSEADDDVLLLDRLEALQLGLDDVRAGHQQRRVVAAVGVGYVHDLRALRSGQRDRRAGHGEPLRVRDAAGDGAGRLLRPAGVAPPAPARARPALTIRGLMSSSPSSVPRRCRCTALEARFVTVRPRMGTVAVVTGESRCASDE